MLTKLAAAKSQELIVAVADSNSVLQRAKDSGVESVIRALPGALWHFSLFMISTNDSVDTLMMVHLHAYLPR